MKKYKTEYRLKLTGITYRFRKIEYPDGHTVDL